MSYCPSCGNVCDTTTPPRVPIGSPGTCASCVVSGGTRITALSTDCCCAPTASRLILRAAEM